MQEGRENRASGRRRTLFGGTIFGKDGNSWDCSISDISKAGVRAKVKAEFEIGDPVDLRINKFNDMRPCTVMWARDGFIGLQFNVRIDPESENLTELFKFARK